MTKDNLNTDIRQGADQKPQEKIEIVDENLKQGFAQMPRPVLRAKGLSFRAKCIYNLLLDYAWQCDSCFPGQGRLAIDLDTSVDTIQRGLKELKEYRLIDWKQAGLNRPNTYYILKLSDCCFLHPDTDLNGKPQTCGIQKPHNCGILTPQESGTKNTKSKNTKIKNTKSFRKAHALTTEKGGEGSTVPARSHIARMATGNRKEEAREITSRGITQTKTNGLPPAQKRVAKIEAEKQKQKPIVGKPLTQEEIDGKRRNGQNASGYTPLSQIPVSHWQELETRAAANPTNGNGNGHHSGAQNGNGLHYNTTTKHAPDFIDALIEQFSKLLHDEEANIPQNINRAAKLYRKSRASEEMFISLLHDAYTATKRKREIATLHSDGRPNKMPYFFSVLEDKLGVKERLPSRREYR